MGIATAMLSQPVVSTCQARWLLDQSGRTPQHMHYLFDLYICVWFIKVWTLQHVIRSYIVCLSPQPHTSATLSADSNSSKWTRAHMCRQMFIWDDPSVTPLSWSFTKGVPLLYPQCGTSILFWGVKLWCWVKRTVSGCKPVLGRVLAMKWCLVSFSWRRMWGGAISDIVYKQGIGVAFNGDYSTCIIQSNVNMSSMSGTAP